MPAVSRLGWLLPFALLAFAVVAVPLQLFDEQGLPRYRALRGELATTEAANRVLRQEVHDLRREVRRLEVSYDAIERLAREELGLVHRGEWVLETGP